MGTDTDLTSAMAFKVQLQYLAEAFSPPSEAAAAMPLSDAQLRDIQRNLEKANMWMSRYPGATPVSVPDVAFVTDMSALSTADLLQLIRTEARKTTDLLVKMQSADMTAQEQDIDERRQETDKKLDEIQEAMDKAENMQKWIKAGSWALLAVSAAITLYTGGLAAGLMLGVMALMTAASEIPVKEGESLMEMGEQGISERLQSAGKSKEQADMEAMYIMIALQLLVMLATAGASAGSIGSKVASTASEEVAASVEQGAKVAVQAAEKEVAVGAAKVGEQAGEQIVKQGVAASEQVAEQEASQIAKSAAEESQALAKSIAKKSAEEASIETGEQAARQGTVQITESAAEGAGAAAKSGAEKAVVEAVKQTTPLEKMQKGLRLFEAGEEFTKSGAEMGAAFEQKKADLAQADVAEIKAMTEYLQGVLQRDADFVQMVMDVSAKLDAGTAEIIRNEFEANQNRTREMYS